MTNFFGERMMLGELAIGGEKGISAMVGIIEQPEHPVMTGLPKDWNHEEEWYSWHSSSRLGGVNVLATVDESTYTPVQKLLTSENDLRMGDHPVVWINCVGSGRSLYAAMGDNGDAFEVLAYRTLLDNGLAWAAGLGPSGCDSTD